MALEPDVVRQRPVLRDRDRIRYDSPAVVRYWMSQAAALSAWPGVRDAIWREYQRDDLRARRRNRSACDDLQRRLAKVKSRSPGDGR